MTLELKAVAPPDDQYYGAEALRAMENPRYLRN